jgi:hypothetical protein
MTWRLIHRTGGGIGLEEDIIGEWTDAEVEQAAQKAKDLRWQISGGEERNNTQARMDLVKEFLPDPIKDVL